MWPWVCSVIDHRRRQNVVRTSVTHSAIASCATFLFLPHFDVICDLLLNRRTATWNLFVKFLRHRSHQPWLNIMTTDKYHKPHDALSNSSTSRMSLSFAGPEKNRRSTQTEDSYRLHVIRPCGSFAWTH